MCFASGLRPHSHHEHVSQPDAILIYTHRGLEALNLRTGAPLTNVPLSQEGATYASLHGDDDVIHRISVPDEECVIKVSSKKFWRWAIASSQHQW